MSSEESKHPDDMGGSLKPKSLDPLNGSGIIGGSSADMDKLQKSVKRKVSDKLDYFSQGHLLSFQNIK